jgi:hypothetical protein
LVIQHELKAWDLSKLDSRYRNKEDRQTLSLGGVQLSYTDAAPRDYKSLNAIVVPLSEYFAILYMYAQPTGQSDWVARQFWRYNVHLSKIAAEYEFAAVVEYHMEFFQRRRGEMQRHGDYSGWGRPDVELMSTRLYDRRKPTTTSKKLLSSSSQSSSKAANADILCHNFNLGKCSKMCPFGCKHACSTCQSTAHGAHNHPN